VQQIQQIVDANKLDAIIRHRANHEMVLVLILRDKRLVEDPTPGALFTTVQVALGNCNKVEKRNMADIEPTLAAVRDTNRSFARSAGRLEGC
jgi:hypothetical protein